MTRTEKGERGSASIVAVAVLAVAVLVSVAVAAFAGVVTDRAAARSAADLSALAGAYDARRELGSPREYPCEAARRTALANSATLISCDAYGDGSVQVKVASGRATAQARAGPEKEGPGGDSG